MKIRVKLMGILKDRTPPDGTLEITDGAAIADVLRALDIPIESVQVFSVNGAIEKSPARTLQVSDDLTVLPPVGGG